MKEIARKSTWIVSGVSLAVLALVGLIRNENDAAEEAAEAHPDEEVALFVG